MGERGESTLTTIVAIALAAILMFIFPLSAIAERNDDVSQMYVKQELDEFVSKVTAKGTLTIDDYEVLEAALESTNNSYDLELTISVKDVNPGKKSENDKVGDTTYYSKFTEQIMNELNSNNIVYLKEGDYIKISVKNANETISQMIKNVLYGLTGNESYVIAASSSGLVTVTGY